MKRTWSISIILILAGLPVWAHHIQAFEQDLARYLNIQKQNAGFNGVVLIAKKDSILFQKSIGWASIEHGVPLKRQSVFKIASVSKTFTAALLARAEEEGLLHLADPVNKYLTDLPASFQPITIHHLLSHTSGLPHHDKLPGYWRTLSKLNLTTDEILKEIFKLDLLFQPGAQMQYSSLGYYLLALVIEKVYHKTYSQVLTEKILSPLNMTATGIVNNLDVIKDMSGGYHKISEDSLVVAPYRDFSLLKGAGDMYSTTDDLFKWCNAMLGETFFDVDTKAVLFSPNRVASNKESSSYGYGWYIGKSGETPLAYHHGGGTWGYSSYMAIYPESEMTMIILCNISILPMESIWHDMERIVFKLPFEMPVVEKEVIIQPEALRHYAGNYISEPGERMLTITLRGDDTLVAQLAGNPSFAIFYKGNHVFFGKSIDALFTFLANADGTITGLQVARKGQVFTFKKL